ncbi:MAG: thermonuclease family protein [Gammaproteobacteria bacterium]
MKLSVRLLWAVSLAIVPALLSAAPVCPAAPDTPTTGIRRVIDGDTLVLADGRHVRFIGINAMELGHDGAMDQPYAAAARDELKKLIKQHGGLIRLEAGSEAYDEHGRSLAYVFSSDGEDLGLDLIKAGLAAVIAVPPDVTRLECYADAEDAARTGHLGIWSAGSSLLVEAADAQPVAGGFLIVTGIVTETSQVRAGVRLTLDHHLRLWVPTDDLQRFASNPVGLKGRKVLVRGWVRDYKGSPELDVHAPAALFALP